MTETPRFLGDPPPPPPPDPMVEAEDKLKKIQHRNAMSMERLRTSGMVLEPLHVMVARMEAIAEIVAPEGTWRRMELETLYEEKVGSILDAMIQATSGKRLHVPGRRG